MSQEIMDKVHQDGVDDTTTTVATDTSSPIATRNKLLSSTDSRTSDSGISAEFSEAPACNGSSTAIVVENGDADMSTDTETPAVRPSTMPGLANTTSLSIDTLQSPILIAPCNSGVQGVFSSEVKTPAEPSCWETSASKSDITALLENLIGEHRKKDNHWEPSGRYHTNLAELEVGIENRLTKKKKAREDARKVLELFLESSLNDDPNFKPSGHYNMRRAEMMRDAKRSTKRNVTSEDESPTAHAHPLIEMRMPGAPRSLSPIIQDESAAERGSDMSALGNQRDSYYFAVNENGNSSEECMLELTHALEQTIRLASVESDEPAPVITPGTTTEVDERGQVTQTDIERTEDGVHIHKHSELTRPLSSSTSLSSILDDGGQVDLRLKDRKKKSFFKRASQRLQHVFHRSELERSDSKSETEADKYSVRPHRERKKKKKGKKKADSAIVDSKILESHQHHMRLETTAHITSAGVGLNDQLWRDAGTQRGVVERDKVSTLPTWPANNGKTSKKTEKEQQKARDRWEKGMKELLKDGKSRKKADRSESSRSNESVFRLFSVKKNKESPKIDRREKSPFSLRKWMKKQPSTDSALHEENSSSRKSQSRQQSDDQLLVPPTNQSHLMSKSAEVIAVAQSDESQREQVFTITPLHSRSRSTQDTSDLVNAGSNESSTSSRQPSSSPTKPLSSSQILDERNTSPNFHRRYIPRSNTNRQLLSKRPPRRHTTQVEDSHILAASGGGLATAGISSRLTVSGNSVKTNSLDVPMSVDANISRTQSLNTRGDGGRELTTVTSVDEIVTLGQSSRKLNRSTEIETDSEIERIIHIPQTRRTQREKDQLYRHIAGKLSRLVTVMESDDNLSSSFNTPVEENKDFYAGRIPSVKVTGSDQSSAYVTARSSSTSPTHRESLELSKMGSGVTSGVYTMEDIDESSPGGEADNVSLSEISVTKTDVKALGAYFRNKGDILHASNPTLGSSLGNYEVFAKMADEVNSSQTSSVLSKIAGVFSVTLKAVRAVGNAGELASQVKENALTYIEDNIASYIMSNGGWDSMLEESNSEID